MDFAFDGSQRVGEIVAAFPGASNLFQAHGIDFCCGGGQTLAEALRARGIAEEEFLPKLQQAYAAARQRGEADWTDWREASLGALIEQIVTAHHAYLRQELPLLGEFVAKIHHVHGDRHPELAVLDQLFQQLQEELQAHLEAEENELFPLVERYGRTGDSADLQRALAALTELEQEHEAAGGLLAAMRTATKDYRLPPDACRTYTLAFQKLGSLEADMFQHIHLENNVLFPRLRQAAAAMDAGA